MNRAQQQQRNTEQEADVVRRHDEDGQDFAAIGRDLGISRERTSYIYRRWTRDKEVADQVRPL